jgi:hypothetical protein
MIRVVYTTSDYFLLTFFEEVFAFDDFEDDLVVSDFASLLFISVSSF